MNVSRGVIRSFVISCILGLAVYFVAVIASGWDTVSSAVVQLSLTHWSVILGLSLLNYVIRFARWHVYIKQFGYSLGIRRHFIYYLAGFAFTTTPGKAGEMIRSLYLKRHKVNYSHSLSAFFVERILDFIAILLLALALVLTFDYLKWPIMILGFMVIVLLPLICSEAFHNILTGLATVSGKKKIKKIIDHFGSLMKSSSLLLGPRLLYSGLGLGLLAWIAEGYAFYLLLGYMQVSISMSMAIGIYSIGVLSGAISFIPGGLGSTEAVMIALLSALGVDISTAVAATFVCRIVTLWFAVALGLMAVGGLSFFGSNIDEANTADN